jgi:arylsulfatase A-like enzyme
MRADHLSCYGYPKQTTPNIDGLAERGRLFRNFFSVGNCTHPGFTAMLTGLFPETSRVVSHWTSIPLAEGVPTLAQCFADAGYQTAAIDNLYDAWVPKGYPYYPWFRRGYQYYAYPEHEAWYKPAQSVTDKAIEWLRTAPEGPFFLFVHYWQPHGPYNKAPERFYRFYGGDDPCDPRLDFMPPRTRSIVHKLFGRPVTDPSYVIAAYDAEVAYADHALGTLLDALAHQGLLDETTVLVTADHGEIMWPPRLAVGRPWCFGHIGLCDDCLRLPLIIADPDIQPGVVVENTQLVDVLPTLAEWCDLQAPPHLDGHSLAPALIGGPIPSRDPVFASENTYQKQRALRTSRWKYTRMEEQLASMPRRFLFDLREDPLETVNLADERPDTANELDALMEAHIQAVTHGGKDPILEQPVTERQWPRAKAPDHAAAED